ncbi:phospholipid-transporting ATPase 1-like [Typha latifolia]|uniref:phospholipid-transporting ATPase 1-like n=1 Tax=Typha latifolia TaxID=4733 RepID=UPI003C3051D8
MASNRPLLIPSSPPAQPTAPEDAKLPDPIPSPILRSFPSQRRSMSSRDALPSLAELMSSSKRGFFVENSDRKNSRRSNSERLGSQKEIADEEARFIYINDVSRTNGPVKFPNNSIRTTKYSILTFLPRNLFEQFHRVAYVYFLVLAALNQVPQLGVFSPVASVLPLAFVLGVTAVKDAYEDWRRHQSDSTENSRGAAVLIDGEFKHKRWKDIQVGELIRVTANETLPCDMVLLATSDPTGVAYIQTINLDGESNLKTRYAKQETLSIPPQSMSGLIKCEKPNRNIYGFQASIEVDRKRFSLGPSNIVLRGCEIKNTRWVIGVAVYTGKDTKVMLNNSGAPSKRSRLEAHMNRETILLAIALALLCSIVSLLAGLWLHRHRNALDEMPYYRKKDYSGPDKDNYKWYGEGLGVVFSFMSSVILFQIMIPISLYISMELVRLGQAFFMVQDKGMFDERTNSRFQCRALNINEDLGQIKYVFSDKTGTLTENKMEFKCASVCGTDYSNGIDGDVIERPPVTVDGVTLRPKTNIKVDPELQSLLRDGVGRKADGARDFFLALATCNTIVPILVDTPEQEMKLIDYQGESPDEQALVYAAAAYGFMLIERTSGHIIIDVFGDKQRYS